MRKLYNLPPTDPRLHAMTEEQIDLEFEHYKLDHPELFKNETYSDPEYDQWEQEAIEQDSRITPSQTKLPIDDEEWEEVEIND